MDPNVERPTYASEESMQLYESLVTRIQSLERSTRDHDQRFDTLQTPWWRRVWFAIDGWPWYDLNGERKHRPWHR